MQSRVLMVLTCLSLTPSSACNFSFGFPDTGQRGGPEISSQPKEMEDAS